MKLMLAYIAYYLGHWISFPMYWFDWGWLYPAYNRLMIWSAELDDEGVIWSAPVSTQSSEETKHSS